MIRRIPTAAPRRVKRRVLRAGINSLHEELCEFSTLPCPFQDVGCTAKVSRRELSRHEETAVPLHLRLLLAPLASLRSALLVPDRFALENGDAGAVPQRVGTVDSRVRKLEELLDRLNINGGDGGGGSGGWNKADSGINSASLASISPRRGKPALRRAVARRERRRGGGGAAGRGGGGGWCGGAGRLARVERMLTAFENIVKVLDRETERGAVAQRETERQRREEQQQLHAAQAKVAAVAVAIVAAIATTISIITTVSTISIATINTISIATTTATVTAVLLSACSPRAQMREVERQLAAKEAALAELRGRLLSLEAATFDGVFLWKISSFRQRSRDASEGRNLAFYSPGGPPPIPTAVPSSSSSSALSTPAPAAGCFGVTMMLLDQDRREHVIDAFRPDVTSSSFQRPVGELNVASGCPLFCPLARLQGQQRQAYVRDDTIFIRCIVETDGV
uniref:TNF receptor associated factor-like protein n=1 Tax=Petromyzon marinus TaxID=7757 RepID=A0A6M4RU48_PETMA|nr:TNF receptor associated factor-like protein [Petromyzon marinus]